MNNFFKKSLNIFFLIFWMGLIFYLSSQPDLKSGLTRQVDFVLRKIAHIAEYGILTFLTWRVFTGGQEIKLSERHSVLRALFVLICAISFSIAYAASDEFHQLFVRGRVNSQIDVLIDSGGVAIAGIIIWKKFIQSKK